MTRPFDSHDAYDSEPICDVCTDKAELIDDQTGVVTCAKHEYVHDHVLVEAR